MVDELIKKAFSSSDLLNQNQQASSSAEDEYFDDTEDEEDDDQVFFLYNQLMNTHYSRVDVIADIERSIYAELEIDPEDSLALIAFLQSQTMLGNYSKAKALAYKIWEIGTELEEMEEYLYINNLLNLGFLEMASVLLKPRFETLTASIDFYYPLLLKLSTMTGNAYLLERLVSHPNAPENDQNYLQILTRYKSYNYADHFKAVQRIIMEQVKDYLCTYDYNIIGGALAEIETILYLCGDANSRQRVEEQINAKLQEYYETANIEKLSSFNWEIKPLNKHPALGLD